MSVVWLPISFVLLAAPQAPPIVNVEYQPLAAQAKRLVETLQFLGEPLTEQDAVLDLARSDKPVEAVRKLQETLDKHVLVTVTINPESRVKSARGPAPARLMQQGWRTFVIKVINEAGVTAPLKVTSPNAATIVKPGTNRAEPPVTVTLADVPHRFLDVVTYDKQPLEPTLSGLGAEYRLLQLYCRDVGKREAKLEFSVGAGTQDVGFRAETSILFEAIPAYKVTLGVKDHDGKPTTASFTFRDKYGRVYPAQSRRLAPDFFFHPQV
ncbi:MAG TPA: hypothetical protein VNC50_07750, partial [Planctomycetia bacterium]|nr:hypothetical protein [Planctomycetia bacterium]